MKLRLETAYSLISSSRRACLSLRPVAAAFLLSPGRCVQRASNRLFYHVCCLSEDLVRQVSCLQIFCPRCCRAHVIYRLLDSRFCRLLGRKHCFRRKIDFWKQIFTPGITSVQENRSLYSLDKRMCSIFFFLLFKFSKFLTYMKF